MLLALIKKQLRIDGSEEDDLLTFYIDEAKETLKGKGIPEVKDSNTYNLAIMLLVMKRYENEGVEKGINDSLQTLILDLKAGALVEKNKSSGSE